MTALIGCVAILLAAGRSTRFGRGDKLMTDFRGRPLADHAAAIIASLPFRKRIAVVRVGAPELCELLADRGFSVVENDRSEEGLSHYIRLGADAVAGAEAAILALADMPFVPAEHLRSLCLALAPANPIAASLAGNRPTVPAAFMASEFGRLRHLSGDAGARSLLMGSKTIPINPALLADIDRPDDLTR